MKRITVLPTLPKRCAAICWWNPAKNVISVAQLSSCRISTTQFMLFPQQNNVVLSSNILCKQPDNKISYLLFNANKAHQKERMFRNNIEARCSFQMSWFSASHGKSLTTYKVRISLGWTCKSLLFNVPQLILTISHIWEHPFGNPSRYPSPDTINSRLR